jgi:hypothetical protein
MSPPSGWVVSVPYEQSEIIVEMIITHEKSCPGFGFVTQFMRWYPARGRNNDTGMMSQCHVTIITRKFQRALVYAVVMRVRLDMSTLVKGFTSVCPGFHVKCHPMGVPQYGSVADAPTG